jgi:hypothetical protein
MVAVCFNLVPLLWQAPSGWSGRWKAALGIWNLRAPPLFPQLYWPFAESEHLLLEGKGERWRWRAGDMTPKRSPPPASMLCQLPPLSPTPSGKVKIGKEQHSPRQGAFTSHEQKSPEQEGGQSEEAPVPVATRGAPCSSYRIMWHGGYRCRARPQGEQKSGGGEGGGERGRKRRRSKASGGDGARTEGSRHQRHTDTGGAHLSRRVGFAWILRVPGERQVLTGPRLPAPRQVAARAAWPWPSACGWSQRGSTGRGRGGTHRQGRRQGRTTPW